MHLSITTLRVGPILRAGLLAAALAWIGCTVPVRVQQPWEIWRDPHSLALLEPGDQVLLRSSYCPSGCRFDRHSGDDWRYLRVEGKEGVIFEAEGAGAITRIWMTTGAGVSQPLPTSVRIRIYLDGAVRPVINLPLPDLFNGTSPPFVAPLVGNRLRSSGGNFSYVPIPYRKGCRITLQGADDLTLWYQVTHHRLEQPDGVETFTGRENLGAWATLLSTRGADPWPPSVAARLETGRVEIPPDGEVEIASLQGPDSLTMLRLRLPAEDREGVELRLVFDGEERVRMSLADFFAAGRSGSTPTRSLLVGTADDDWLYTYFPMPFFEHAEILLADLGSAPVAVAYEARRAGRAPSPKSGLFGARLEVDRETDIGTDIPLLELSGRGKWVGLFAELGSVATHRRDYLEGDERVYIDGAPSPALHGTGTEDFFNGGFYFDQGPFQLALHGAPYHLVLGGEDITAVYRLMLTDAIPFTLGIRAELEGGPSGNLSLRRRSVAYYYLESRGQGIFADGFEAGGLDPWTQPSGSE